MRNPRGSKGSRARAAVARLSGVLLLVAVFGLVAPCAAGAVVALGGGSAASLGLAAASADVAVGPNAPISFRLFPADNAWNSDVSGLPVLSNSATYLTSIGLGVGLHPDFGTVWDGAPIGIPYVLVRGTQAKIPITFYYADESDPGPYPIPLDAPIEGGSASTGDRHVLTLDVDNKLLYEVFDAHYNTTAGRWEAGSGAIWDLDGNALRPAGWTSADAAGLPILPGLVRYDEVASGEITHALRFTVPRTQKAYVYPATHYASSSTDPGLPPMGLRVRLKAGYDISGFPVEVQVILRALKKYGMIVADNGSAWYISGAPDPRWNDDALHALSLVKGSDFEAVASTGTVAVPHPPPPPPVQTAPTVSLGGAGKVRVGRVFFGLGHFTDDAGSPWTATVDYGDGTGTKKLALTPSKRFVLRHTYTRRGTFQVTVSVRDNTRLTGVRRMSVAVQP